MARRTRKQKEQARMNFSWTPKAPSRPVRTRLVKGQSETLPQGSLYEANYSKKTAKTAKEANLSTYKKDLLKSLVVAGLILGVELVLYFAWR